MKLAFEDYLFLSRYVLHSQLLANSPTPINDSSANLTEAVCCYAVFLHDQLRDLADFDAQKNFFNSTVPALFWTRFLRVAAYFQFPPGTVDYFVFTSFFQRAFDFLPLNANSNSVVEFDHLAFAEALAQSLGPVVVAVNSAVDTWN